MDLIKIGKYIAGKRKSLGMTQKQLAEKIRQRCYIKTENSSQYHRCPQSV